MAERHDEYPESTTAAAHGIEHEAHRSEVSLRFVTRRWVVDAYGRLPHPEAELVHDETTQRWIADIDLFTHEKVVDLSQRERLFEREPCTNLLFATRELLTLFTERDCCRL